jgi:hypothetical protein
MTTAARLIALSFATLTISAGCSSAPEAGLDNDYKSPSKADKDDDGEGATLPSKAKSDDSTPAPETTPAPAPTTPSTPATPAPTPPAEPVVDTQSCNNLGQCCQQIANFYAQLACAGVQLKGDQATCAKSLIACRVTIGLGNGGGAAACNVDKDCPGAEICVGGQCQ